MGQGRAELGADAHAAGGLAEDRDLGRIAAEGADVALHPCESRDLIAQTVVARAAVAALGREGFGGEETEGTETVVERHDNHIARPREGCTVVERGVAPPLHEPAPVDEDHHGVGRASGMGPHVEGQAALVADDGSGAAQLGADRAEGRCVEGRVPGGVGSRGREAERSDRGGGVGDATEDHQVAVGFAVDGALVGVDARAEGRSRVEGGVCQSGLRARRIGRDGGLRAAGIHAPVRIARRTATTAADDEAREHEEETTHEGATHGRRVPPGHTGVTVGCRRRLDRGTRRMELVGADALLRYPSRPWPRPSPLPTIPSSGSMPSTRRPSRAAVRPG